MIVSPLIRRLVAIALGLILFVSMLTAQRCAPAWDHALLELAAALRHPDLTEWVLWITPLGKFEVLGPVTLAISIVLFWLHRSSAVFVVLSMASSALLMQGLKHGVARARPGELWSVMDLSSYSFPSGHAMATMTLAVSLTLVLTDLSPAWISRVTRLGMIALLYLFTVVIGLTRIYLGVHHPTDVLAGWGLAVAWVVVLHTCLFRRSAS